MFPKASETVPVSALNFSIGEREFFTVCPSCSFVGKMPTNLTFSIQESSVASRDFGEEQMVPETLSESELHAVEDVLGFIRRNKRLTIEEREDIHSWVWVRLAETDYRILRKFEHR